MGGTDDEPLVIVLVIDDLDEVPVVEFPWVPPMPP